MQQSLFELLPDLHNTINSGELRIILASGSPRRVEALEIMLDGKQYFDIMVSGFDEKLPHTEFDSALAYCLQTAKMKAQEVCQQLKDIHQTTLIIAADTVVAFKDHILEKPSSTEDATRMLDMLNGTQHQIHTCVAVYRMPGLVQEFSLTTTTEVKFANLTQAEIAAYVATGEPLDKAGSYAIQGKGSMLIESIQGDFFSGVGFPAREFAVRFAKLIAPLIT